MTTDLRDNNHGQIEETDFHPKSAVEELAEQTNPKAPSRRNKNFLISMYHALKGIFLVVIRERNMRFHLSFAFFILVLGLYLGLNRSEWLWVVIAVFLAVYGEFLNTVVEAVVDLVVERKYHPLAGLVKDVSAGMVLVAVGAELIILALIFQPHIWHYFGIETNFSRFVHRLKG
ncbi:diacylglycerol kinase family protein [Fructobacillus cardui]|jgi:undecaprenol kinase|uniref:Diacylglycerol kinase (DgkA) n=1 Tax=Fructobacillus cardui TaxID=2893170 RepID=A0ABM9MST3_9LACO|nr:diacylglycerol kinase family protein [Fructobacillus cardui]MCK8627082.1 diacylglycerol kinase family protein [Fructobacillus cardui]CAK1232147.1 Diacylglycerol kinase (DgkA) [Fructobacillus cardui]CAK1237557.1 Diacylglycerol kinase (DgkA) [Fructobacillus cardui]CAK1253418.1 Diacylglycerol kinase (DgkA) [Fructobacillus cardui]